MEKFHNNSDLSHHSEIFHSKKEELESHPLIFSKTNSDPYNAPTTLREIERVLEKRKNSCPGKDSSFLFNVEKTPQIFTGSPEQNLQPNLVYGKNSFKMERVYFVPHP